MADKLRNNNLIPIIFDFERATSKDFTGTIQTLAGLCFFVIADITNPKSAPLELQAIVPDYKVPFVTIIQEGEKPFPMFKDLQEYDWVLKPPIIYPSLDILMKAFEKAVIDNAFEMHKKLIKQKAEEIETIRIEKFLKR